MSLRAFRGEGVSGCRTLFLRSLETCLTCLPFVCRHQSLRSQLLETLPSPRQNCFNVVSRVGIRLRTACCTTAPNSYYRQCYVESTRSLNALVSPGALSDVIRLKVFSFSNFLSLPRRAAQAAAFSGRVHGRFGPRMYLLICISGSVG